MHIFLNCMAAHAGGGVTYLRNVVPCLSARIGVRTTVAASSNLRQELGDLPNIAWADLHRNPGTARRFSQEQATLPGLIRASGADVLISSGNFALWRSPVPQILLSGNSLYTSADFYRDLRFRGDYRVWLDTRIKSIFAKRSVYWADRTVAPSRAFAEELLRWTGAQVLSIHHGFNYDTFCEDGTALPTATQQKLDSAKDALRLLFVSHYNYYRNFETLLRAIPLIQNRLRQRRVVLFLTCQLSSEKNPGSYRAEPAAALVQQLGISELVVELGAVPYQSLHHVYRACHIYVTPAYTETFAHPLVEAMASGVPVVAADLPIHREVCGEAAQYFQRFSPEDLADQVLRLEASPDLRKAATERGRNRSCEFSWEQHVEELLGVASSLVTVGSPRRRGYPPNRSGETVFR
jgi:glycosyltransferase involved in cell wall biosynthesis